MFGGDNPNYQYILPVNSYPTDLSSFSVFSAHKHSRKISRELIFVSVCPVSLFSDNSYRILIKFIFDLQVKLCSVFIPINMYPV